MGKTNSEVIDEFNKKRIDEFNKSIDRWFYFGMVCGFVWGSLLLWSIYF